MAHLRNQYREEIDFKVLAEQDKDFSKYFKSNGQLDFTNAQAVKQLTKSLLKRDFGLSVELPDDRLCPPVPNRFLLSCLIWLAICPLTQRRLNYILWLQDLLDSTSTSLTERYDPNREVIGLDIGTGASAIYPLLGTATRPKWKFIATEIDEKNLHYASKNIALNNLSSRVKLQTSKPSGPLIPLDELGIDRIDFTLTNPPFYSSTAELLESADSKSRPAFSACTGSSIEMVTEGGEVAFVKRIIAESARLRGRVQWYSTMLGKLGSVREVVEALDGAGLMKVGSGASGNEGEGRGSGNWAIKEFVQGQRTRRWGVAWSWGGWRPAPSIARTLPSLPKHLLPFPSIFTVDRLNLASPTAIGSRVNALLAPLDMRWQWKATQRTGVGFAERNVWSRAARRGRRRKDADRAGKQDEDDSEEGEEERALGVKIVVRDPGDGDDGGSEGAEAGGQSGKGTEGEGVVVEIRWLVGKDSVLFESFCGMVKREVTKGMKGD